MSFCRALEAPSLQAFDEHLNMVLGDVEEVFTRAEVEQETKETIVKTTKRSIGMLLVRGDVIILVTPPLRTA